MREFVNVPQTVRQELLLPEQFPQLPAGIRNRFGAEVDTYNDRLHEFWTRTRRALQDVTQEVARPLNEVKESVGTFREEYLARDAELTAFVRETAEILTDIDGYIGAKYALEVVAGGVITGMRLMSIEGPEGVLSDITFLTNTLNVVATVGGTPINLLQISPAGFVFGTDLASDNFVAGSTGWQLTRAGVFELNTGTFRGVIAIGTGANATSISPTGLQVGNPAGGTVRINDNAGTPYLNFRYGTDVFGSWSVSATKSVAQWSDNAGHAVNIDGAGQIVIFGTPGIPSLVLTDDAVILGTLNTGTHAPIGAETVTGYITINDSTGTPRKLAVLS